MKNFIMLVLVMQLSITSALCADMRFIQVDGARFNIKDEASVSKFENLIADINKQKEVEFIVFSGDNIASARKENLEGFLKTANNII